MAQILFKNANLLDPRKDALQGGSSVLVEGELIREVSAKPLKAKNAQVIDCKGRTLMPGLIDCHAHVMLSEVNIRYLEAIPLTMMTVRAAALARAMIDRGFTTVRDTGGCDWGMRDGIAQGLLPGPRLFIAGRAIGPTGGHSDPRRRTDTESHCHCCNAMNFCMELADGADAVRAAVREQLRQGADQIKIMASGGVASPTDPIGNLQFSVDEVKAAVRGSGVASDVCDGACVHAESDCACREARRADHRARQSDRRRSRRRNDRAWRVRGADARHV